MLTGERRLDSVRSGLVVIAFVVGISLVAVAVLIDGDLWPSVILEIGAGIGLAGVILVMERAFVRTVREEGRQVAERVEDLVGYQADSEQGDELRIDVEKTATDRGQQPKILVRIVDPDGDYRTRWSVTLTSPNGVAQSRPATWPGAGPIFRARFPAPEPRTGVWRGEAIRNGAERHLLSG